MFMKLHTTSSGESIPVFGMEANHLKNTILLFLKRKSQPVTEVSDVERLVGYTLNYEAVKKLNVYIASLVARCFLTGDRSYVETVRRKITQAIGRESRLRVKPSSVHAHKSVFGADYEIVTCEKDELLMKIKRCMSEIPSVITPINPMLIASGMKDQYSDFDKIITLGNSAFSVVCNICLELVIRGEYESEVLENALLLFGGATTMNNNNDIAVHNVPCNDEDEDDEDDDDKLWD